MSKTKKVIITIVIILIALPIIAFLVFNGHTGTSAWIVIAGVTGIIYLWEGIVVDPFKRR